MKKIRIVLLLISCSLNVLGQNLKNQEDKINKILSLMDVKQSAVLNSELYFKTMKEKKPGVNDITWNEIRNSINYDKYVNDIRLIITEIPDEKLNAILAKTSNGNSIFTCFPESINNKIYKVGNDFGKYIKKTLDDILIKNGYKN